MTYTFKLSRRLAQAHIPFMLVCLAFLFACSGSDLTDASSTNDPAFTGIEISPSQVVLEPNQQLSLKTLRHSVGGASTFDWTTSGGTISSSGMFSAAKAGTYTLIGKWRHGGHGTSDTTVVVVTPTPPSLVGLTASPDSVTLPVAHSQVFTALGTLSDGSRVTVPVTWVATGGSIDASGLYTAGSNAGSFQVIAHTVSGNFADTASVTLTLSPPPSPPTVTAVEISPVTASIRLGASQRYTAQDRLSNGSTAPGSFTYHATGGTITTDGLYTPGRTAGKYQVIATMQGGTLSDTAQITVTDTATTAPPPPPPPPPPPTQTGCVRTVNVSNVSELSNATGSAQPGDCIMLAAGTYSMPTQNWTRSGTANDPITIQGTGSATVLTTGSNGGIYLKASYWHIRKLRVTNGFFGIQTEGSAYTEIDSVEVDHMQQAGINLRYGTNHSTVKNSKIHDTGVATPKWGEGVYVGGYASASSSAPDDAADDNAVLNSTFWNNGAESIDTSDGTDRMTIVGNSIDGTGTASIYGQTNSLISVRGTGYVITDNVLSKGAPYGIDQYNGSATYRRNTITGATTGINISGGTATVYCDNQSTASVTCKP